MSNKNGHAQNVATKSTVGLRMVKASRDRMMTEWPKIRLGCLMLKNDDKHGDSGNWTDAHIRAQLEMGYVGRSSCELFTFDDEQGVMQGFVVTVIGNCPYLQVPQSIISWVVYSFRHPTPTEARLMIRSIEEYGKSLGLHFHDTYTIDPRIALYLQRFGRGYRVSQTLMRKALWEAD